MVAHGHVKSRHKKYMEIMVAHGYVESRHEK